MNLASRSPAPPAPRSLRAFTLVELLVVIFIIGGLIALLIPVVGKVRRASQGAATQAQMAAIATAIQSYYSDFRAYPGPLPNTQVGITYFPAGNYSASPQSNYVYVYDPAAAVYVKASGISNLQTITGAENLVLGLLGGLDLTFNAGSPPTIKAFSYNSTDIFPSGSTPAPIGAMNLNPTQPKRFAAYLQVKTGDISNGNFVDAAQRTCGDTNIPEFLDKYSQQMPILYFRSNPGAPGVVTNGGVDSDISGSMNLTYQYDLAQVLGYTGGSMGKPIGTTANDPARDHHGLQGLGTLFTGISTSTGGANNAGANAMAYLKDPSTPAVQPGTASTPNTNYYASPRQKDGFLLVSPGPDGVYGTSDDLIYPGSLNP